METMWGMVLLFMAVLSGWLLIEHLRGRPRRTRHRDFRRMESTASRQRRHAAQRAMGRPVERRGFSAR